MPDSKFTSPKAPRGGVPDRAGTHLDPRYTEKILAGGKAHGVYDTRHELYQTGGERSNFIFFRERLISLDLRVWDQIRGRAQWIEWVDHENNEVYRTDVETAARYGKQYNAGIGERWGVPLDQVVRLDKYGHHKSGPR